MENFVKIEEIVLDARKYQGSGALKALIRSLQDLRYTQLKLKTDLEEYIPAYNRN